MDLISRQAAIDAVTKYCLKYDLRELLADIECLPTAEKKGASRIMERKPLTTRAETTAGVNGVWKTDSIAR